jgi:F-type H+-transporting ATPase subunit b
VFETILSTVASTEKAESTDILTSLGIDWTLLVLQLIAFLILVFILGKFVYPVFMKIIDERQAKIDESTKAADEAKAKAESASEDVAKALAEARKEAKDIVATAKQEATAAVEAAESKAANKAQKIVESAHEQITKDVIAAQKTLHNETIDLVAQATEKVLATKVDGKADQTLIASALKGAK